MKLEDNIYSIPLPQAGETQAPDFTMARHHHLMDLSDEVLLAILAHLSADNAALLLRGPARACRRLRRLCSDPSLWKDVGLELEVPLSWDTLIFGGDGERRRVLEEETAFVRGAFEAVGRRLHCGTLALRVGVRRVDTDEKGEEGGCRRRRIPWPYSFTAEEAYEAHVRFRQQRPRFQDTLEAVLRERCPNLEALSLSGLAPRQFGDCAAALPSVRHLSYDMAVSDTDTLVTQSHEDFLAEWSASATAEAMGAFYSSPLRRLVVRNVLPAYEAWYCWFWHLFRRAVLSFNGRIDCVMRGIRPYSEFLEEVELVGFAPSLFEYLQTVGLFVREGEAAEAEAKKGKHVLPKPVFVSGCQRWRLVGESGPPYKYPL